MVSESTSSLPVPEGTELVEYVVEGIYAVGEGTVGNDRITAEGGSIEFEPSFMLGLVVVLCNELHPEKKVLSLTVPASVWEAIAPKLMAGILSLPSMADVVVEDEDEQDGKQN